MVITELCQSRRRDDGGAEQQTHDAEWKGASVSSLDGGNAADGISPCHCERWRGRQLTDVCGLTSRRGSTHCITAVTLPLQWP